MSTIKNNKLKFNNKQTLIRLLFIKTFQKQFQHKAMIITHNNNYNTQ